MQESTFCQFVQIFGGTGAGNFQRFHQEIDFCVGMIEQVVNQVLAVEVEVFPDAVFVVQHRLMDVLHGIDAVLGGLFHGFQHIQQPTFPIHPYRVRVAAGGNIRFCSAPDSG